MGTDMEKSDLIFSPPYSTKLNEFFARKLGIPVYRMGDNWPGNAAVHEESIVREVVIRNLVGDMYIEHEGKAHTWDPMRYFEQAQRAIVPWAITIGPKVDEPSAWTASMTVGRMPDTAKPVSLSMHADLPQQAIVCLTMGFPEFHQEWSEFLDLQQPGFRARLLKLFGFGKDPVKV